MEYIKDPMLATSSRALYNKKLNQYISFMPKDRQSVGFIVDNPGLAVQILLNEKSIAQTKTNIHMFSSAIVAYIQHTEEGRQRSERIKRKWLEIQKNNWESHRQNTLQELSETDQLIAENVKWDDLESQLKNLPLGSYERLLLAMYTMIPPVRADYGEVRINPPQSFIKTKKTNYLIISEKSGQLVIRDFKTVGRYKEIKHDLKDDLLKEILASLHAEPRNYLFVMKSNSSKPYDRNGFSKWANKILQDLFHVPITLTSLRHIFISTLDFSKMRVLDMERVAHEMGHSIAMQKEYQWLQ
jgi:hypothetical protein